MHFISALRHLLEAVKQIGAHLDAFAAADGDSSDAGAEVPLAPAFEARVDAESDDLVVGADDTLSPAVASGTLGNATLPPAKAEPASAAPPASEAQAAATTVTEPRRAHASTARFAASISPAAAAVRRTHARAPTNARTTVRIATTMTSAIAKSAAAMSRWTA